MHTDVCQRWRGRRASYVPAREVINPRNLTVCRMSQTADAKRFVEEHHYSGTFPAARWCFALYEGPWLAGVAVFSHPANDRTLTNVFGGAATESVELGRFVLLDRVAANAESFFLSRCLRELQREGLRGVLSFSDPVARYDAHGARVFVGHIGTAYKATAAPGGPSLYLGRTRPSRIFLLSSGVVFSARALSKIRALDVGWRYGVAQLVAAGAPAPADSEDLRGWVERALLQVTRRVPHEGNHRYAWPFSRALRRELERSASPYPVWQSPS